MISKCVLVFIRLWLNFDIFSMFWKSSTNPGFILDADLKSKINMKYKRFELMFSAEKQCISQNQECLIEFEDNTDKYLYQHCYIYHIQNESTSYFKYCDQCKMFKLPRMNHWNGTDRCVLGYQFYSKLFMNSIGIGNYYLFIQFYLYLAISMIINIGFSFKNNFINPGFEQSSIVMQLFIMIHLCMCIMWWTVWVLNLKRNFSKVLFRNMTKPEMLQDNFLISRAVYLFGNEFKNEDVNIYDRGLLENIRLMLTGHWNGSAFQGLFLPYNTLPKIYENPLKYIDHMRMSKPSVKKLINLKEKVESKLNEKFIQKGIRVKIIDYSIYLDKISF